MNDEKDPLLSPGDALMAENELLKLKLGLEHGMQLPESTLPPHIENQWLRSVYAFEQQFKDAKRIKVYDYLGQPTFRPLAELTAEEIHEERQRLEVIMEKNNINLTFLCDYDESLIYRFITEELFHHEMDDMRIPGMTLHFTYEEFHPNHDYDIRRDSTDFLSAVYVREWNEEFDDIKIARETTYGGNVHDRRTIGGVIRAFQDAHYPLKLEESEIREVQIEEDLSKAAVRIDIRVSGKRKTGASVQYTGVASIFFTRIEEFWYIERFELPGFGSR